MRKLAGNDIRSGQLCNFASRAFFQALLLGLTVTLAAPLWPQRPASPAFEEVEKQAAEARDANQPEEAVARYREGLKLRPSWKEGSWYLGTSLYGLKRYAEARDAFRHLAILEPGNGPAWGLAGMCEFELANYPQALEYLLRSESAGFAGKDELAYLVRFRIALLLNRSGEPEKAIDRLIPIAATGTYPEVIEAMGLSLLRVPLLPSEIPEQDRDLYLRAGEAMHAYVTHDSQGAARLFEELVTAYPDHPNVHYARGSFLMQNDPEKALLEFHHELELNPSHPNALLQMAMIYLKQGAAEKALPYARRAVKANPNLPAPHRVLGESLIESGETSAAIQELQTAARQAPEFPQTHFLLAEAYKRAGNKVLASKEIAEFERLDRKKKSEFRSTGGPR
jgi:tetratricopeptide (TPR) repeat protein